MNLICIKKSIMIGALNRDIAQSVKDRVQRYIPWELIVGTAIESGLNNVAGICHPAMLIFNAGRIGPDKEDYYFNKDGITPEIATLIERLDNERMDILRAMGFDANGLPEIMHKFYGEKFASLFDFFKGSSILNSGKLCPKKMRNRYIEEDIPDLLLPWLCLAKYFRLKYDAIETTIAASSLLLNENYFKREAGITAAFLPMLAKHQLEMA